jgi:Spy/CpxP family protein refolding chaperone
MNRNRFARRLAIATGCFFLCAAPGPARGQGNTPRSVPSPPKSAPVARSQRTPSTEDDFAGLEYTDEQKARINQIHQDMKSRMDVVVKDEKLNADQRNAMLQGYGRMERAQVFKVLTPEQQKEVLKKIRARRVEQQQEKKQQHSPPR